MSPPKGSAHLSVKYPKGSRDRNDRSPPTAKGNETTTAAHKPIFIQRDIFLLLNAKSAHEVPEPRVSSNIDTLILARLAPISARSFTAGSRRGRFSNDRPNASQRAPALTSFTAKAALP